MAANNHRKKMSPRLHNKTLRPYIAPATWEDGMASIKHTDPVIYDAYMSLEPEEYKKITAEVCNLVWYVRGLGVASALELVYKLGIHLAKQQD